MPEFELEWSMQGRATIDADDRDEAENTLADGLMELNSFMFNSFDVDEVTVDQVEEVDE